MTKLLNFLSSSSIHWLQHLKDNLIIFRKYTLKKNIQKQPRLNELRQTAFLKQLSLLCFFVVFHFRVLFFYFRLFLSTHVRTVRTISYAPVEKRLTFYNTYKTKERHCLQFQYNKSFLLEVYIPPICHTRHCTKLCKWLGSLLFVSKPITYDKPSLPTPYCLHPS